MGDSQFLYMQMHVPVNICPDNTTWFIPFQIHKTSRRSPGCVLKSFRGKKYSK